MFELGGDAGETFAIVRFTSLCLGLHFILINSARKVNTFHFKPVFITDYTRLIPL
jgi:hypothetical protein